MPIQITRNGSHRLLRGTTVISTHSDIKEAYERASKEPNGTYTLVTADETIVVTQNAVASPVNCSGTWGPWTRVAGSESACVNGQRTYQESRSFTVTTPASNGGTACPTSPEIRTVTEACGVPTPSENPTLNTLLKFGETWNRNWNFEGHAVDSRFNGDYGLWDYNNTTYEPWLFDRVTVGYRLFQLTNDQRWRDKFLSDFDWYRQRIDAQGIFTPKGSDDTKYSYVTPFLLYERLTGDQQYRPVAQRIKDAWLREWPDAFNRGTSFWTEREMAFALEAAVSWFELTGEGTARINSLLNHWDAACIDGVPQVTYTQHEGGGPGGTEPTNLTNSPWMSALYFQAARRAGELIPAVRPQVDQQLARYADWFVVNGVYEGSLAHPEFTGLLFPRYLTGELIGDAGYDEGNMDHSLDVAGMLTQAVKAKTRLGQSPSNVQTVLDRLLTSANRSFENWTRTTTYLPKYRLSPPRKFNWWVRGFYELGV